jgi:hypothetical protein
VKIVDEAKRTELFEALSRATSAPDWPARWLTLQGFLAALDERGFWAGIEPALSPEEKQLLLTLALEGHRDEQDHLVWVKIGPEYKHGGLLTPADRRAVSDWCEEQHRWLDKQLRAVGAGHEVRVAEPRSLLGPESLGDCLVRVQEMARALRPLVASRWPERASDLDMVLSADLPTVRRAFLFRIWALRVQVQALAEERQTATLVPDLVEVRRSARLITETLQQCPDLDAAIEASEG